MATAALYLIVRSGSMCTCDFTGVRTCHCSLCHETFGSPNAFDWHQKMFLPYGPVCLAPELVVRRDGTRVLFRDSRGYWRENRPDLRDIGVVMRERAA